MKIQRVSQTGPAIALLIAVSACANLIGLSDYEVDESSTPAAGGAAATGGGGTAGSAGSAGTGGTCIPTADPRTCGDTSECCDGPTRARCVDFPERGTFCASSCTANSECRSNCCAPLPSGVRVCAFPEFCGMGGSAGTAGAAGTAGTAGRGGSAGTGGSGGGIGSPCTTAMAPCGSGTNAGTCNGRWCTKTCTTSVDCPGNNWCIRNNAGTNTCFVGCTTSTNCAQFSGTVCQSGSDVSGLPIMVCTLP